MANINSLARFKAKKEVETVRQIPSNITKKKKLSCIISDSQTENAKKANVKTELTTFRSIIMVKFNNKLI